MLPKFCYFLVCLVNICCAKSFVRRHRYDPFYGLVYADNHQIGNLDNGPFRMNFLPSLGHLFESRKRLFQDVIDDEDDIKHDYGPSGRHRSAVLPQHAQISPDNVDLLNDTAKIILSRMYKLLSNSTSQPRSTDDLHLQDRSKSPCTLACSNGGICRVSEEGEGVEECFCLSGYRGRFCEYVDECSGSPGCDPNAKCVQKGEEFKCECREGFVWQEKGCIPAEHCQDMVCQNGGTCLTHYVERDSKKSFCRCKLGFRGEFCEEVIPNCEANPCQNGQTCLAKEDGLFYCVDIAEVPRMWKTSNIKYVWFFVLWCLIPLVGFVLGPVIITTCEKVQTCRRMRGRRSHLVGNMTSPLAKKIWATLRVESSKPDEESNANQSLLQGEENGPRDEEEVNYEESGKMNPIVNV